MRMLSPHAALDVSPSLEDPSGTVAAIGVSGDGIEPDENVAQAGTAGFESDEAIRIDTVTEGAVPYIDSWDRRFPMLTALCSAGDGTAISMSESNGSLYHVLLHSHLLKTLSSIWIPTVGLAQYTVGMKKHKKITALE
jgi:hypothetical protein